MNILIGGAWPYANGSLHLGHIASLLSGDILARYYRAKGEKVLYVSGSDCNGTPISIRAKQEGVTTKVIADKYHEEFSNCFKKLGFTYDCYTRTDTALHHEIVQDLFLQLLKNGYIYKREVEQAYCHTCDQFLPDRYVEGICPNCKKEARGDQCDYCSEILDPLDLLEKRCKICCDSPSSKKTEHFYIKLSAFQTELKEYVEHAKKQHLWRENAIHLTERYLKEGLHDRPVSRDLPIGVSVPVKGYEEKKIYVWIEAVAGYFSASKKWAKDCNQSDVDFWKTDTKSYYIHGKDNIPFHTIIWPSILLGAGIKSLPKHIVSNEYLTIEKKKLSTSKNWAVWVPYMIKKYEPDSIRYFLTINAPENRDSDFSWREFIYSHNSELLGAYGNFVNRTLKFLEKSYSGIIPMGNVAEQIKGAVQQLYDDVGKLIEDTHFKHALEIIFDFIRKSNKYFDEEKPWIQIKDQQEHCDNTMATCMYIIVNLAQLLHPFLPFSSEKIKELLEISAYKWEAIECTATSLKTVNPLFNRVDVENIAIEVEKLKKKSCS
ncbi:methionine--tRNA ligase [Lederbergia wuyishanensis]|uniref:Methionine--tRNA ligase n=1 Tax=Lederbergia wuyishanensis TaxID=1347903 RepID=A0ABU0D078_9BACI|nr:methionine--tRNA ligase [Lederbergia wuyishanensis]MCJ8006421.1 methionine--tRNA ligase [Lederbergia wuyishanensis]MDQ0341796.1 methionyl-tRNA synthetase [Lederbergia wuyishanensis]